MTFGNSQLALCAVAPTFSNRDHKWRERLTIQNMERKIFWISFAVLGLLADFLLPIWWALGATIPIGYISWWIAYRSGWFE